MHGSGSRGCRHPARCRRVGCAGASHGGQTGPARKFSHTNHSAMLWFSAGEGLVRISTKFEGFLATIIYIPPPCMAKWRHSINPTQATKNWMDFWMIQEDDDVRNQLLNYSCNMFLRKFYTFDQHLTYQVLWCHHDQSINPSYKCPPIHSI